MFSLCASVWKVCEKSLDGIKLYVVYFSKLNSSLKCKYKYFGLYMCWFILLHLYRWV